MAPSRASGAELGGGRSSYLGPVSRFWARSYAPDYVGFLGLLAGYLCLVIFVEPFHRMFAINDLRISFPHAEVERVPLSLDFVYALFVPLLIVLVFNALTGGTTHKHHVTVLGLAISLILSAFLTDLIKNGAGRPRPDLISRCKPAPGTPTDRLVTIDVCTETDHHTLHDGWRSFPSGHSSFAFAGLGYLSLFLAGQMRIFVSPLTAGSASDTPDDEAGALVRGDLGKALLCLVPLLGATMVAISRCQDYRHDVYDVCVGSLLGWTVAYWSYRRYWPRLNHSRCGEPYPSPAEQLQPNGRYGRVRDEEQGGGDNAD